MLPRPVANCNSATESYSGIGTHSQSNPNTLKSMQSLKNNVDPMKNHFDVNDFVTHLRIELIHDC